MSEMPMSQSNPPPTEKSPTVVRVIPCLDVDQGRVVKGTNFVSLKDAGDPLELAEFYSKQGADELVFLDITASSDARDTILQLARRTADEVHIPFTIGGGIRSVEDARNLLKAGADKVSLNTAAVARPELISEVSQEFGAQCTVVAIDARRNPELPSGPPSPSSPLSSSGSSSHPGPQTENSPAEFFEVTTHGGRTPTGMDAILWAQEAEQLGAGEILLTSMDADGTKDGYDIALTSRITSVVNIPTIASGGAGTLEHLVEAVTQGGADAVLAASIFHYGEFTIAQAKEHLASANIRVRPPVA